MKFCPKCGGVMVPVKKGDKIVLKCKVCGYEEPASEEVLKKYRVRSKGGERVFTTKVISKAVKTEAGKEELEQAREEFYELVLDQLGEYGE